MALPYSDEHLEEAKAEHDPVEGRKKPENFIPVDVLPGEKLPEYPLLEREHREVEEPNEYHCAYAERLGLEEPWCVCRKEEKKASRYAREPAYALACFANLPSILWNISTCSRELSIRESTGNTTKVTKPTPPIQRTTNRTWSAMRNGTVIGASVKDIIAAEVEGEYDVNQPGAFRSPRLY